MTRLAVAKDRKPKPGERPVPPPAQPPDVLHDGGDDEVPIYTEHIKVPLEFKERLDRIAQRVNQRRKRQGKRKRPVGWFVVTHLDEWMTKAEAALDATEEA